MPDTIKFIDLFAGIGGIRLGFEQACLDVPSAHIGYDLIGNTVCPPVIKAVAERLLAV